MAWTDAPQEPMRRPGADAWGEPPRADATLGSWFAHVNTRAVVAFLWASCWFCGIASVVAIVQARRARREIAASDGHQAGRGLALVASVIGWVGLAFAAVMVLAILLNGFIFSLSPDDAGPL